MALRHFIKKKRTYIDRNLLDRVSLFTPLPGWMLRQEQWRLTWLAVLAAIPPLFPLTFIAFLGGKPTNLLSVLIQYRVGFVLTRYACSRGARASKCVFIVGETRRITRAACTGKKGILRWPSSQVRLRSVRASLAPLLEQCVDASSSVSARAFTHVCSKPFSKKR